MATNISLDDLREVLVPYLRPGVRASLDDETIVLDLDGRTVTIIAEGEGSYLSLTSRDLRLEQAVATGLYPWDFLSELDLSLAQMAARVAFINTISQGGQTTCGTDYAGPLWLQELRHRAIVKVVGYTKNDSPIYGLHPNLVGLRERMKGHP